MRAARRSCPTPSSRPIGAGRGRPGDHPGRLGNEQARVNGLRSALALLAHFGVIGLFFTRRIRAGSRTAWPQPTALRPAEERHPPRAGRPGRRGSRMARGPATPRPPVRSSAASRPSRLAPRTQVRRHGGLLRVEAGEELLDLRLTGPGQRDADHGGRRSSSSAAGRAPALERGDATPVDVGRLMPTAAARSRDSISPHTQSTHSATNDVHDRTVVLFGQGPSLPCDVGSRPTSEGLTRPTSRGSRAGGGRAVRAPCVLVEAGRRRLEARITPSRQHEFNESGRSPPCTSRRRPREELVVAVAPVQFVAPVLPLRRSSPDPVDQQVASRSALEVVCPDPDRIWSSPSHRRSAAPPRTRCR